MCSCQTRKIVNSINNSLFQHEKKHERFFYIFSLIALMLPTFAVAQTDSQLRDPEFLIQRYNELAAKHNALVDKTRNLVAEQATPSN